MASNNLPNNALELIRTGHYYAVAIKGVTDILKDPDVRFIPFSPAKETGHVMVWRKNNVLAPAAEKFLQYVVEESNKKPPLRRTNQIFTYLLLNGSAVRKRTTLHLAGSSRTPRRPS